MSDSHYCKRHGIALTKNRWFNRDVIYVCPKPKCRYKENEEGEMI